jgi:hypothetical protein
MFVFADLCAAVANKHLGHDNAGSLILHLFSFFKICTICLESTHFLLAFDRIGFGSLFEG